MESDVYMLSNRFDLPFLETWTSSLTSGAPFNICMHIHPSNPLEFPRWVGHRHGGA